MVQIKIILLFILFIRPSQRFTKKIHPFRRKTMELIQSKTKLGWNWHRVERASLPAPSAHRRAPRRGRGTRDAGPRSDPEGILYLGRPRRRTPGMVCGTLRTPRAFSARLPCCSRSPRLRTPAGRTRPGERRVRLRSVGSRDGVRAGTLRMGTFEVAAAAAEPGRL